MKRVGWDVNLNEYHLQTPINQVVEKHKTVIKVCIPQKKGVAGIS